MRQSSAEVLDQIAYRHEARHKLESALEQRSKTRSKISLFFINIAVRRAERAILASEARILELPPETQAKPDQVIASPELSTH